MTLKGPAFTLSRSFILYKVELRSSKGVAPRFVQPGVQVARSGRAFSARTMPLEVGKQTSMPPA